MPTFFEEILHLFIYS